MEHGPSGAAHALPPLLPRRQSAGMLSRQQAGELEEAECGVGTPMALPAVAPPPCPPLPLSIWQLWRLPDAFAQFRKMPRMEWFAEIFQEQEPSHARFRS